MMIKSKWRKKTKTKLKKRKAPIRKSMKMGIFHVLDVSNDIGLDHHPKFVLHIIHSNECVEWAHSQSNDDMII